MMRRKIGKKGFTLNVRGADIGVRMVWPYRLVLSACHPCNFFNRDRHFCPFGRAAFQITENRVKLAHFGRFFWRYLCSFKLVW